MTIGALILGTLSLITNEQWVLPTQANTWIALGYLVVVVTIIAFLLYLYVLGRWTATGTSYGFVIIPLVTVVVAATIAGEQITLSSDSESNSVTCFRIASISVRWTNFLGKPFGSKPHGVLRRS